MDDLGSITWERTDKAAALKRAAEVTLNHKECK